MTADQRQRSRPMPVGKLLESLLERRHLSKPLRLYRVQRLWPSLVGEPTAGRSRPTSLRQGVLSVAVADSTWVQELTYLKQELLERVQSALSAQAVTALRFYVRAGAASEAPAVDAAPPPEPDPLQAPLAPEVAQALDEFESSLDSITDPELRRSIRRAFVYQLLREK
ncbi:MAG: DUF721 domain-containing protein [bacterium]